MTAAYNGKAGETIEALTYDGYGNRLSVTQGTASLTYHYDENNQVLSSSAGEQWQYDALGNVTLNRKSNGDYTKTTYDAERHRLQLRASWPTRRNSGGRGRN